MSLAARIPAMLLCVLVTLASLSAAGCENLWVDPAAYEGSHAPPDFAVELHVHPPAPMSEDEAIFAPEQPPAMPPTPQLAGLAPSRPLVYILHPNRRLLIAQPTHQGADRKAIAQSTVTPEQFNEVFALALHEDLIENGAAPDSEKLSPDNAYEGLFEVYITAYNKTNHFKAGVPDSPGTARLATLLAQLAEPQPGSYR